MPLPLPVPPIVKNAKGESIVNPLTKYVKGITLQPTENYSTVTVPAATGNQPGISPTITYQTPVSGYVEVISPVFNTLSNAYNDVFITANCTRYSGKQWSNRPIPLRFMFGIGSENFGNICPGFNEIAVAPLLNSQQNITIQAYNVNSSSATFDVAYQGRLIDIGANALTGGELVRDYQNRNKVMPFWLTVDSSIVNTGNPGNTGMPGMTFVAGTVAGTSRSAVFVNKFPNVFIANSMMIQASIAAGANVENRFTYLLRDKSSRALMNTPVSMDEVASNFDQPYFFDHPITFQPGDIMTIDIATKNGIAPLNEDTNVMVSLFGMALL